ncbi:MAG: hypothetical protein R2932_58445 [Caldilineaceae bacterium]
MELTILATLAKLFGPTLACALFAAVLKDKVELTAIGSAILRNAGRQPRHRQHCRPADRSPTAPPPRADFLFDEIGEKAAKELHDVFKREGSGLE